MKTAELTETEERFLTAMHDVVASVPANHVYDQTESIRPYTPRNKDSAAECSYVNYRDGGTAPSCLIGRALVKSELMTIDDLKRHEGHSAFVVLKYVPGWTGEHHKTTIRQGFINAMDYVQNSQDSRDTWHQAYLKGLLYLSEMGYKVPQALKSL